VGVVVVVVVVAAVAVVFSAIVLTVQFDALPVPPVE